MLFDFTAHQWANKHATASESWSLKKTTRAEVVFQRRKYQGCQVELEWIPFDLIWTFNFHIAIWFPCVWLDAPLLMNFLVRRVYVMWRKDIIVLLWALIKIDDILRITQKHTLLMTQFRVMCLFGFLIIDERSQIVGASLWKSACAWDHYDHDIWCIINHWYLISREAQLSSDEHKYLYSKQPKTNHRNVKCIFNLLIFLLNMLFDVCFRFFRVLRFLPLIDFNDCERSFIFLCVTKSPCHGLQSCLQWFTIDSHFNFSCYFLSSHRCLFWLTGNFIIHPMHWVSPYTWFVVISLCLLNANFRTRP